MSFGLPQLDSSKATSWVYPKSKNFAIRDYQVDICKHALFLNTLVCLPTGLGKTLIAAVVMYNYYRWFPTGKVIFLAPTKPLVNQQINACHDIMGIPEEDIAHLEGSVVAAKRETLWSDKRVFFCTPQTLMNDLTTGRCNPKSIVCIVIDEAHRATGQYAYTTVIQEINMHSANFRVLALSATPGSDARKVQAVISNLLISHIELRSEDDPELQPYTHQRQIDIVVCEQGAYNGIQAVRKLLNDLMEGHVNKLTEFGIVQCESVNQLNFLHVQEAENAMRTAWMDGVYDAEILHELNTAVEEVAALLRCRKALCDEGLKALLELLNSMKTHHLEYVSRGSVQAAHSIVSFDLFTRTVDLLHRAVQDPKYLEKRQPKLNKLKEILRDHFTRHGRAGSSTRALVFSQLRSTVHEIKTEISDVPGIKAHEFVGQGTAKSTSTYTDTDPDYSNKGLTQADQARILQSFNAGQYNVLVATSIAEEGLDIAEVDLIVLFESVASPIRLVQRCGRTGRKRSGKVVMLVSQGQEESKVEKSHDNASEIAKTLRHASKNMHMYAHNPVMFPAHRPLPTMVLQDMCVQVFRPSEIAGGMSRNTKTSSSGAINGNSAPSSRNQTQNNSNKLTKPGYSMSAYLGGSANRNTSYNNINNSSNKDRSVIDDAGSPEWIPTHTRTNNNTNNITSSAIYTNRMSLSKILGASNSAPAATLPPQNTVYKMNNHGTDDRADIEDQWEFNDYDNYGAGDDSNMYGNTAHSHSTSYSNNVDNTTGISVASTTSYNNYDAAVNDDADLYSWGADASFNSVPLNSTTSHSSNPAKISYGNTTNNSLSTQPLPAPSVWASRNTTSSNNFKKAIEVVDLLDSPLVKSNKKELSPRAFNNTGAATAITYHTSTAAPTTFLSSVGTVVKTSINSTATAIANTTTKATAHASFTRTNNSVPTAIFKPNFSTGKPNSVTTTNAPFNGIRLTNVVRSSSRNISFVALDDDLSLSSADEATPPVKKPLPQPPQQQQQQRNQNMQRSAAFSVPFPTSANTKNSSTAVKIDKKQIQTMNEEVEGLSDTQSEQESEPFAHPAPHLCTTAAAPPASVKSGHASSASIPVTDTSNVAAAPVSASNPVSNLKSNPESNSVAPPRSQYVDNSGIDWGSSQSQSQSQNHQEKEMEKVGDRNSGIEIDRDSDCEREKSDDSSSDQMDTESFIGEGKRRRKVPRIKETQEFFFSQCSISEEEEERSNHSGAAGETRSLSVVQQSPPSALAIRSTTTDKHNPHGSDDSISDSGNDSDGSAASDTANACCACLDHVSYEHDVIVFCEGLCGACIHVSCYGVLYDGVPEGDFYCEGCMHTMGITNSSNGTHSRHARAETRNKDKKNKHHRGSKATCVLCNRSGGLMTLSTTNVFVHPICVLFTPELTFCPQTARADNLSSLDKDRKYIKCEVCQEIGGAVVQCAEACCLKAAHPFCAYEARRQMVVRVHNPQEGSEVMEETPATQVQRAAGRAYTQQHTQYPHHRQMAEDNDGEQFNTYELYCTKHRSLPSVEKKKDTLIATSRLPLRDPGASHSVKDYGRKLVEAKKKSKKKSKKKRRHSIGIADQDTYSSDDSNKNPRTAEKKREGVQFVVKRGGVQEKERKDAYLSSPGDLVDTAEKPPRDDKKKMKRAKSSHQMTYKHHHKRRRTDPAVARFFELEAALSGSDSGDDESIDESDENNGSKSDSDASGSSVSTQLSGNFINDGTYTQHSPQGEATQFGMYLAVNNYHSHMRSPDDFVRGKLNVAGLVRRKPLLQSSSDVQDTQASDASPSNSTIIADTPQGTPNPPRHQRRLEGARGRRNSTSWLDSGTQESYASDHTASNSDNVSDGVDSDDSEIESELDSKRARKHSTRAGKDHVKDDKDPRLPVGKPSLMAQLSKPNASAAQDRNRNRNNAKIKPATKKFVLSHEKENARNHSTYAAVSGKSTFFKKLALRGLQDNSSDDSDEETKKKKGLHKKSLPVATTTAAAAAAARSSVSTSAASVVRNNNAAQSVPQNISAGRSRMPVSVDLTTSPSKRTYQAAAPASPFGWGF